MKPASLPAAEAVRGWEAIAIHPEDNVAVALADLVAASIVRVRRRGKIETFVLLEPISLGHKFALEALSDGEIIRKYGESIGAATAPIATGAHVHVHNLRSQRARRSA